MQYTDYNDNRMYFKFVKKDKTVTVYNHYSTDDYTTLLPESFSPKKTINVGAYYYVTSQSFSINFLFIEGTNIRTLRYNVQNPPYYSYNYSQTDYDTNSMFIGQYRLD